MRLDKARRNAYLHAMGIEVWVARDAGTETAAAAVEPQAAESLSDVNATHIPAQPLAHLDWTTLEQKVASCTQCGLHKTRKQTVFGVGDHGADWLFIGEAPGSEEDRQGEPFVGRAGQLLDSIIRALGLRREQTFIANILKCRPPKNRDPRPEESQCCRPYLRRQIDLVKPRIVVALGRVAAQNLLETDTPIGKLRGREYTYEDTGVPLVVTYHPAYLLRRPEEKRKVWDDLKFALKLLS